MSLELTYHFYDLPLRHPFTISRYTVSVQKTVIACISDGEISGYGEATANPFYGSTQERIGGALERLQPIIKRYAGAHPTELWSYMVQALAEERFALCAADMAYWDYYTRKLGLPLREILPQNHTALPQTSYTIGIDSPEIMQQKIADMPWPVYKVKLGFEGDMATFAALRKTTPSAFRIDANAAWELDQAQRNSEILAQMQVEFIEQPMSITAGKAMRLLKTTSALPLIADEGCQVPEDVDRCADGFHGVNIKLMKCGGITPALGMISRARELGLQVMLGCMTESSVGISGLVQMASLADYLDADGALLLASDIASGVTFDQGRIVYVKGSGTGIVLH